MSYSVLIIFTLHSLAFGVKEKPSSSNVNIFSKILNYEGMKGAYIYDSGNK
jgi:hypothetical protein